MLHCCVLDDRMNNGLVVQLKGYSCGTFPSDLCK